MLLEAPATKTSEFFHLLAGSPRRGSWSKNNQTPQSNPTAPSVCREQRCCRAPSQSPSCPALGAHSVLGVTHHPATTGPVSFLLMTEGKSKGTGAQPLTAASLSSLSDLIYHCRTIIDFIFFFTSSCLTEKHKLQFCPWEHPSQKWYVLALPVYLADIMSTLRAFLTSVNFRVAIIFNYSR